MEHLCEMQLSAALSKTLSTLVVHEADLLLLHEYGSVLQVLLLR